MSRPIHRGISSGGGQIPIPARDPFDRNHPENGLGDGHEHEHEAPKYKQRMLPLLIKLAIALVVVFAALSSLYWTISISTLSQVSIYKGYRRLQLQLVNDLSDIGELSLGSTRLKELDFCSPQYEDFVPCYNNVSVTTGDRNVFVDDRRCEGKSTEDPGCLILPPKNYKIPLRWPSGGDFIWRENVKITVEEFSSGSLMKRMMVEEEQVSFRSDSLMVDGVEDYAHQIAEMIGLTNELDFNEAGVRTILDIECGFGSFGAHLFTKQLLTMCTANYESSGSQVQVTLERGMPAIIASFESKKLPYPYLSFDMLHCARCGIDWEKNDGILLVEVDRLLRPGGYFVWTSPTITLSSLHDTDNKKKWTLIRDFADSLCWEMLPQQYETVIWKKTSTKECYSSRKSGPDICGNNNDLESSYYQPLNPCIGGTKSPRWLPIEYRTTWPSRASLNSTELDIYGVRSEEFFEDSLNWNSVVNNYWSLLSPLIFSDHPKRPGDEDPPAPFNMLRNVLDMNARFGGFNAALLDAGKSVWVMNVVPTVGPNYLPLIVDRGFVGVQHDWCEAFPTYPRTYDMVHAEGLLSLEQNKCSILDIFLEIDRILRPEGWVMLHDTASLISSARSVIAQLKWDGRMIDIDSNSDEKLLVCQKPFIRRQ